MKKNIGLVMFFMLFGFVISKANEITSSKYVTLSGYLNLSGSIYVPAQNSYASGYVSGWLSLRDFTGKYYTNSTYINVHVNFFAGSNYVYVTAYPNHYLTIYKDSKSVGSIYLTQSVLLSGWISGNYAHLTGSSYINQSVYVKDEE